jgi:hypothetical protein
MSANPDLKPLKAFFKEVEDQLEVKLHYQPDNPKFPIQLDNAPDGISNLQCDRLLEFIKGQVDLRDNEIGTITPGKISGNVVLNISDKAAHQLAEIYALSLFYDADEDEE